jgi:hypothetical protein
MNRTGKGSEGHRFKRGNPGKPKGTKHRRTRALQALELIADVADKEALRELVADGRTLRDVKRAVMRSGDARLMFEWARYYTDRAFGPPGGERSSEEGRVLARARVPSKGSRTLGWRASC